MDVLSTVINLFVLLFAITIHEASHGWAALKMGDPTAYTLGRVSLNPIVHIDLFGTIILPLILVLIGAFPIGWAKPVPVNPYNLRHPRRDNLWVSLAGPASNLTAAAGFLVIIGLLKLVSPGLTGFLRSFLISGRHLPPGFYPLEGLALILFYAVLVNTYLAVFNLIPVPPLDGSGILSGLLSEQAAAKYDRIRPFGFFIVIILIYLGLLNVIIRPIELLIYTIVLF
jgi:Zn-dependent protease